MTALQTGVEVVTSWAISNSDPANLLLLAVVYMKLSRNHDTLQSEVQSVKSRVEDLHDVNGGDE